MGHDSRERFRVASDWYPCRTRLARWARSRFPGRAGTADDRRLRRLYDVFFI
jgi:hypothetical protein